MPIGVLSSYSRTNIYDTDSKSISHKYNSFTLSYNDFKLKLTIIQYFFIFPFVLLP